MPSVSRSNAPTVGELAAMLETEKLYLDAAKKRVQEAEKALEAHVLEAVRLSRQSSGKSEGVIHVTLDGCDVKASQPKTVKWDQKKLEAAALAVQQAGHSPEDWIDVDMSITEKKWEAMPPALRKLFEGARTLKHGKQTYEITKPE